MNSLILDNSYTNALLVAMYEDGYLPFNAKNEIDKRTYNNLLEEYKRKKIKKDSMIFALLYDELELVAPFNEEGLKNRDIPFVIHNPTLDDFDEDNLSCAIDIMDVSLSNISKYRDLASIEDAMFKGYAEFRQKHRKLHKILTESFYRAACLFLCDRVDLAIKQIPASLRMGKTEDEAIVQLLEEFENDKMSPYTLTLFMNMIWLSDTTFLFKQSRSSKKPFVTNRIDAKTSLISCKNSPQNVIDAFERCVVLMKQEIPYVPKVKTFSDVLRLREKKELKRFKEVLNEWVRLMGNDEINLAEKMRSDIIKANQELKKYSDYENRSNAFFFWFSFLTSFIPVVPSIAWWGIENAFKGVINHKTYKSSWVGIGRS